VNISIVAKILNQFIIISHTLYLYSKKREFMNSNRELIYWKIKIYEKCNVFSDKLIFKLKFGSYFFINFEENQFVFIIFIIFNDNIHFYFYLNF